MHMFSPMDIQEPTSQKAFLETVSALYDRSLPAADLGARVRLSKTPEAYLASRASHPEPQYEALLAAGRTRWYPGERVRYYRTRNKKYVWLPDENEEASVDYEWETESIIQVSEGATHHFQKLPTETNGSLLAQQLLIVAITMPITTSRYSSPRMLHDYAKRFLPKTLNNYSALKVNRLKTYNQSGFAA
jgi:hypothetical protein